MGNSKRTAVILTALPVECKAVCSYLKNKDDKPKEVNGVYYVIGEFVSDSDEPWRVAVAEVGKGDTNAALETTAAIDHFKPECIFFVGVAGGIKGVQLADVVAGDKVYDYEHRKEKDGDHGRPQMKESTKQMIGLAKYIARTEGWIQRVNRDWLDCVLRDREMPSATSLLDRTPSAYVGPIATGRKLLADTKSESYRIIKRRFEDTLAVEMESVGFLHAVHNRASVPAIVIRGISDLLDDKSVADAAGSQEVASAYAAAFTYEMLNRLEKKEADTERWKVLSTEYDETIKENIRKSFKALNFDQVKKSIAQKAKEKLGCLPAGDVADLLCDSEVGLNKAIAWLGLAAKKHLQDLRKTGADQVPLFVENAREILGWLVLRAVDPEWLHTHSESLRRENGAQIRVGLSQASCVEIVISRAEGRRAALGYDGEQFRVRGKRSIEIGTECGFEPGRNLDLIVHALWEHVLRPQPVPDPFEKRHVSYLRSMLKTRADADERYYLTIPLHDRGQSLTAGDINELQGLFPLLKVILFKDSQAGQALVVDEMNMETALRDFLEKVKE